VRGGRERDVPSDGLPGGKGRAPAWHGPSPAQPCPAPPPWQNLRSRSRRKLIRRGGGGAPPLRTRRRRCNVRPPLQQHLCQTLYQQRASARAAAGGPRWLLPGHGANGAQAMAPMVPRQAPPPVDGPSNSCNSRPPQRCVFPRRPVLPAALANGRDAVTASSADPPATPAGPIERHSLEDRRCQAPLPQPAPSAAAAAPLDRAPAHSHPSHGTPIPRPQQPQTHQGTCACMGRRIGHGQPQRACTHAPPFNPGRPDEQRSAPSSPGRAGRSAHDRGDAGDLSEGLGGAGRNPSGDRGAHGHGHFD
jgi:hypothetical protein